jgi:hypothetical protein
VAVAVGVADGGGWVAVAVAVAIAVAVGVGVCVAVAVAVGVTIAVAVAVAVAVGVGVGVGEPPPAQKISMSAAGVAGSYPPANQMRVVPSLSVGKLRRAFVKCGTGEFTVHVFVPGSYASTSVEGLGATLPPPITNILPLKGRALVSPVALGMAAMAPVLLLVGLKLKEFVVSITVPPE